MGGEKAVEQWLGKEGKALMHDCIVGVVVRLKSRYPAAVRNVSI